MFVFIEKSPGVGPLILAGVVPTNKANILCKGYGRFPWRMIASYNNHFKYLSLVSEEVHTRTPCIENEEGNHVWEWKMIQNMEEETTCCNHIIFVSYYDTNKLNTLRDS